MKQNLAAKRSTLPPQSLIVWRIQSSGLFWRGPSTWCHAKATLTSRMYLTANVDQFFSFFFHVYFISFRFPFVRCSSFKQTESDQFWVTRTFFFHDMPVRVWLIPEVETDAGGETRCNARPSQRSNKKQCSGYALRSSFFFPMPLCPHGLSRENVSVHVRQARSDCVWPSSRRVCAQTRSHVWPTRVLLRHTAQCPRAFIFSVQAAEAHWRVPMTTHAVSVCDDTTLVELTVSLNVFYAFFHWSVPEKMRRVLFALFIYIYIKRIN